MEPQLGDYIACEYNGFPLLGWYAGNTSGWSGYIEIEVDMNVLSRNDVLPGHRAVDPCYVPHQKERLYWTVCKANISNITKYISSVKIPKISYKVVQSGTKDAIKVGTVLIKGVYKKP